MIYCRLLSLLLVASAFIGCRTGAELDTGKSKPTLESDGSIHMKPELVRTNGLQSEEVTEDNVIPEIVVAARVRTRAGGAVQVFSPFPGRLVGESPLPLIGDLLRKGQFIADVEQQFVASEKLQFAVTSIQLESEIQQAQQEVDLHGKELSRAQQLYSEGAAPLKQLQTAEAALKQSEAKLAGARRSKEKYDAVQSSVNSESRRASIVSPISGTVVAANATLGQQVEPAKSLLTIADMSRVWVEAAVHERDLARVRSVRTAEIEIPGSGEQPFVGRLVTIGNLVDPLNRTVPVVFSVENRGTDLKIEMFVEAHIPTGPPAKELVIPSSAVLSEEGSYSVYVETEPGVFRRKAVKLGQRKDTRVVVTSGLEKGEKVVTIGAQALRSESLRGEIPVESEEKAEKKP